LSVGAAFLNGTPTNAAQTLREEGFGGRVVLLGAERERPYDRPPLSKEYLRNEVGLETVHLHDEGFYEEHAIELRTGTAVEAIAAADSAVVIAGGGRERYDRLLLATGARPRRLSLPGSDLRGIYELRTLADSDALSARLHRGGHVAIVGAGWIGCEVAASARRMGLDVTMIEPLQVPLQRVLGPELGAFYRDVHVDHGVHMLLGRGVVGFAGDEAVGAVVMDDGMLVECDFVVVSVGVSPRIEVAARAGIEAADGILVDEYLQTSMPNVYAAGDIARAEHPLLEHGIRVEHWANALHQGEAAARNMLGALTSYDRLPYFFSDQYDIAMEYTGHVSEWDEVVIRGDVGAREFIAFWLREGRVQAGMNVNVPDVAGDIEALIGARMPLDAGRLTDTSVALEDLLPAAAREG
jgi:3-phenylpropionate/trans-cinnamate dioxygenase ferredoxin reductase subunit